MDMTRRPTFLDLVAIIPPVRLPWYLVLARIGLLLGIVIFLTALQVVPLALVIHFWR